MRIDKKIFIFFAGFIIVGILIAVYFPKEEKRNSEAVIRVGSGDDMSGILMEETIAQLDGEYIVSDSVESSSFQDCWSNIAQWALSAEEINIAFYCGHIAVHTIEENENVMIYGPVIMNSEIICYKNDWEDVKTVGVSQGREQEKKQAKKTYPQIEEFRDVTQKGILYTLEDEQVDAVIQDLTKSAMVPNYPTMPLSSTDYVSYVLVVDKAFVQTEAFNDFINSYNKAVKKLNEPGYLAEKLNVEENWLKDKTIRFLPLEESEE